MPHRVSHFDSLCTGRESWHLEIRRAATVRQWPPPEQQGRMRTLLAVRLLDRLDNRRLRAVDRDLHRDELAIASVTPDLSRHFRHGISPVGY